MEPSIQLGQNLRGQMGFSFMEAFMDQLEVESNLGKGTIVRMKKKIGKQAIKEYTQETGLNAV